MEVNGEKESIVNPVGIVVSHKLGCYRLCGTSPGTSASPGSSTGGTKS